VNVPATFTLIPKLKDALWEKFLQVYQQLANVINGGISMGQLLQTSGVFIIPNSLNASRVPGTNIDCVYALVTTPGVANTDFTVVHNLGRPLTGYIVVSKGAACDLYSSPTNVAPYGNSFIFRATATNLGLLIMIF
jgi:hypothetical protein